MRRLHIALALALSALAGNAQDLQSNPVTQAIMQTYDRLIREDPTDYEPYYRRAADLYRMDQYLRALSDINDAIRLTPADLTETRFDELVLRANIYLMTERPAEALADFDSALALNPTHFNTIHQKANTDLTLGNYAAAKAGYQRMQGLSSRSPEALFGLARVAIKERNYGQASDYADQAVQLNSGESSVYVTRSNIRQELGNNNGAVEDLIAALSIDANNRALSELLEMGHRDYPATITALSEAIKQAPNVEMFRYLRAQVAMLNYHYRDAIADFNTLIEGNQSSPGIYGAMAECHYALGNYAQAAADIEYAISSDPKTADHYITLAKVRRAQWRPEDALAAAEKALELQPSNGMAMEQKSLALVDLKRYDDASTAIGEALMTEGDRPMYLLIRGWILNDYLNQPGAAKTYYKRAIDIADTTDPLIDFAQLFDGHNAEAKILIESQIAAKQGDPYTLYLACCLAAQSGDTASAISYMERALKAGYANYHDWTRTDDARVNVAPIRDEKQFNELLTQYKSIF